ncbi:cytochrome c oxidase assembly protein COX15 homolog [Vespula pensylvanica]|uniref:Cytochrome c oxidase assembly protein COX15 n=1 Tax=Vespula pensylvanica TaxID=30213 RepID=A0A834P8K0_VESPE|nr:cytochrome c oxidase assembly protein COX15 homolog [Vespula pensylvanica]KAF7432114.1 hypothetical protein H0235_005038 [Vespula pensylvanica]
MLNVTRYCSKSLTNYTLTKCLPPRRNLLANKIPKVNVFQNAFAPMKRSSFLLKKESLRQSGTIAINYTSKANKNSDKIVGSWLLICGGMVFVAVALGGVTRLTESGLSMVTWKLLGEKMPINEEQWHAEFERYKQFPEYKITNKDMTLDEFKRIWWMEYFHRTWGRLIGGVFLIPATYFWFSGMLKSEMKIRVAVLGSLIGLQGLMGWYMVKSGLEDRFNEPSDVPRVSQYRLASHLGLAFIIYSGFLYNALSYLVPAKKIGNGNLSIENFNAAVKKLTAFRYLVHSTKGMIFLTAVSGAFVAGMDAGLIYNTFPKMADKWIPDDLFAMPQTLKNFTENPTTAQFQHRYLGIFSFVLVNIIAILARNHKLPGYGKTAVNTVLGAGYLQVSLGILTLLYHVPVPLAASHQCGSLILLSSILWLCHELKYVKYIKTLVK